MRPDQSITYLKSIGYTVLRLPRPDTRPLQVLQRNGKDLDRLGDLTDLMQAGVIALPDISGDNSSGTISGRESSKVDVGIGLTILGNIIRAMGGSDLGLEAGYRNAKTMTFQYADVIENSVPVTKIEQYLAVATIKPENSEGLRKKLIDDEVYVITSSLKSRKFVVDAQAEKETDLKLDVPVISEAIGGKVKVGTEGGLNSKLAFEGSTPLVFGIQAVRLFFNEQGRFTTSDPLMAGDGAVRSIGSDQAEPTYLQVEGAFARMN